MREPGEPKADVVRLFVKGDLIWCHLRALCKPRSGSHVATSVQLPALTHANAFRGESTTQMSIDSVLAVQYAEVRDAAGLGRENQR